MPNKQKNSAEQNPALSYLKYKICVSGAAETDFCADDCFEKTKRLGRAIIENNGVCVTGATTGAPYWAAIGAKEAGGISIGFSPAGSEAEHVNKYKLPVDYMDIIVYTGFDFAGRNLILTRAADAVIFVCGRMGTLNEFTIAFEDHKPLGVLTDTGGMADELKSIVEKSGRGAEADIVYDSDPEKLVKAVLKIVDKEKIFKPSRNPQPQVLAKNCQ
ncbi:MAG: hypothetical protein COU85_00715 [Candidatus Portnoybacteria bacterium CG10_big_fil_rev_8_21_14_0_10_44_7]|uniref:Protein containing YHS domain protein n=1 Tax=Candidatus Portnoybacteria bacterium CG10_big_fil_rev_8_21_14_0_10_44_7 TaxID=1974816 RepID=A0A2M8KJ93_9BACT|nr:MAG: hypothetical protein COU85_00715 [Candidatus Portnoybacteria bacterium CG10_big_fil_rev_8_21_14_0_10_44_7]